MVNGGWEINKYNPGCGDLEKVQLGFCERDQWLVRASISHRRSG